MRRIPTVLLFPNNVEGSTMLLFTKIVEGVNSRAYHYFHTVLKSPTVLLFYYFQTLWRSKLVLLFPNYLKESNCVIISEICWRSPSVLLFPNNVKGIHLDSCLLLFKEFNLNSYFQKVFCVHINTYKNCCRRFPWKLFPKIV